MSAELERHVVRLPQEGVGVVLVEHDLTMVMKLCPRVLVLNRGQLIAKPMRRYPDASSRAVRDLEVAGARLALHKMGATDIVVPRVTMKKLIGRDVDRWQELLGDHHIDLVGHERLLVGFAHGCLHPAMILASAKSFLDQPLA